MFENIGKKIKRLAETICWIGIIISVIGSIILFTISADAYEPTGLIIAGFSILIFGTLFSWIGSFFMYGFGELIDNSQEIKEDLKRGKGFYNQVKDSKKPEESYEKANEKSETYVEVDYENVCIGICQKCDKDQVLIRNCVLTDDLGTRYRKLCEDCINTYNQKKKESSKYTNCLEKVRLEIVSEKKSDNTKVCLECSRSVPLEQEECVCGSRKFDNDWVLEN